jgi:hypothetical protein
VIGDYLTVPLGYFIAVCILMVVYMIIETIFYRKAIIERDTFAKFLELYIEKYGKQSFIVEGEGYDVE